MSVNLTRAGTSLSASTVEQLPVHPVNSIYVHVPFCLYKCHYCDFYSIARPDPSLMERYVASAIEELGWWKRYLDRSGSEISTLFLGGGTPTALPAALMARLLGAIRERLPLASGYEWTVEANPATTDRDYCAMLLHEGVNRMSFGAQSLVEAELRTLGRVHNVHDVPDSLAEARRAGFERLSIDLMYATPGQTLDSWMHSLRGALDMGVQHISCYCLTLEESTPMYRRVRSGEVLQASEELQLQFMKQTRAYLAARGLAAYEISNYAIVGEECRHNLVYWDCGNYIGIGPGAATHIAAMRWRNAPDVSRYAAQIASAGQSPLVDIEQLSPSQRGMEMIMMSLRTSGGLRWDRYQQVTGRDGSSAMGAAAQKLKDLGLLEVSATGIRLTDSGVYVADEVIGELVRQAE